MERINEVTKKGWRGTVAAMLQHHPEKFGKGKGKLNPWAIAHSMAKKGYKAHYKDQESSLKGKPHKKKNLKMEFKSWLESVADELPGEGPL